jgi:Mlc titration factor MtfA (ptsG expression regulator)
MCYPSVMRFWKERQRRKLRGQPFPQSWVAVLESDVPLYRRLPADDRRELHGHIHVFLAEKHFEGCGGLAVTDEIRVVIAAQACVLLLHRDTDYFPDLTSILVYPSSYVAPVTRVDDGIVSEYDLERTGETWEHGSLVLSWDDVAGAAAPMPSADAQDRRGNGRPHDRQALQHDRQASRPDALDDDEEGELVPAYNIVLHEFAHQLDLENGELDGTPRLESREAYERWSRVFEAGFRELEAQIDEGIDPVIDDYALDDEVEFFAVVTESFFETPFALRDEFPDVYRELRNYFRQDPVEWFGPA